MNTEVTAKELQIDKYNLDEEVIQQPILFQTVSEQYVRVLSQRDYAKETLSRVRARLYLDIKQDLRKKGDKFTETSVSEAVILDPEYQRAYDRYHQLCRETESAMALRDAFYQRAYVLKDLVNLHGFGYFMKNEVRERPVDADTVQARREMVKGLRKGRG